MRVAHQECSLNSSQHDECLELTCRTPLSVTLALEKAVSGGWAVLGFERRDGYYVLTVRPPVAGHSSGRGVWGEP